MNTTEASSMEAQWCFNPHITAAVKLCSAQSQSSPASLWWLYKPPSPVLESEYSAYGAA